MSSFGSFFSSESYTRKVISSFLDLKLQLAFGYIYQSTPDSQERSSQDYWKVQIFFHAKYDKISGDLEHAHHDLDVLEDTTCIFHRLVHQL